MPSITSVPSKHLTLAGLKKLNGRDKIITILLSSLLSMWTTGVKAETLPCLNSSTECVEQLTEAAIANSGELQTLEARIGLLDRRLSLADSSINYAESKLWTNYIPDSFSTNPLNIINPFSWIKNIFGGGDIQKEKIAIADLELKKANVEAQRAQLERRHSEVQSQTREQILTLVLEYEAAGRQAALIATQLNNHRVISQVMEIDYRFGGSSTESYLAAVDKKERLENHLIQTQIAQQESLRKILSLTGFTTKRAIKYD